MRKAAAGAEVGVFARTGTRQAKFAAILAETCNVSAAARAAGVAASTCYRWRAQDAGFAASWDAALGIGYDRLEAALLDYALERIGHGAGDPAAISPDEVKGSIAFAVAQRCVSHADLQFAVGMLTRHRAAGEGRKAGAKGKGVVTRAEADAALRRALDGLARRVKPA
ncbi:hypothetical protein F1C10_10125 [Sphingomonas sp. NBWT7]|uniref:hypothetical protein n=1 Tax=Sphingomonas sp. NBWT7 TaxID=2596913 RepID=UPI001623CF83|nr:hypothetical protein [Sphingomonas sp. NBWT7]QNE32267.1 hypothetical protein F1C10_10125 [Sphingomonas sp. NBWT7]